MAKARQISGLDPQSETRYSLPVIFSARIAELWSFAPFISDPGKVAELHDMRIAAKRLRYCFEFFGPLFGAGFKARLDTFKKLQDFLGEIHDCDVWVDFLRGELDDSFERIGRLRGGLKSHVGASIALGEQAAKLRGLLESGPFAGLLMMIEEVVERRSGLYRDLLSFWNGLEARDFRGELLAAVTEAVLASSHKLTPVEAETRSGLVDQTTNAPNSLIETEADVESGSVAPPEAAITYEKTEYPEPEEEHAIQSEITEQHNEAEFSPEPWEEEREEDTPYGVDETKRMGRLTPASDSERASSGPNSSTIDLANDNVGPEPGITPGRTDGRWLIQPRPSTPPENYSATAGSETSDPSAQQRWRFDPWPPGPEAESKEGWSQ